MIKAIIEAIIRVFTRNPRVIVEAVQAVESSSTVTVTAPEKGIKIVLDPGHGGRRGRRDPGAIGKIDSEEIYERDVVLEICKSLAFKLDAEGFEVIMTRIDNDPLAKSTLGAKVRIVNAENPDIFISVHANSNAGRPAQGIETFYHKGKQKSQVLARKIQSSLISSFPTHKDRGIKDGSHLYVLDSSSVEASCLVECEFINHPDQVKFLVNKTEEIAEAILSGIKNYIGGA